MGFMVVDPGEFCSRTGRGRRIGSSGRWSPRCAGWSGSLTHPGAAGAAHLYLLLDQYAPWRGLLIGARSRVSTDISAHGRLTIHDCLLDDVQRLRSVLIERCFHIPAGGIPELAEQDCRGGTSNRHLGPRAQRCAGKIGSQAPGGLTGCLPGLIGIRRRSSGGQIFAHAGRGTAKARTATSSKVRPTSRLRCCREVDRLGGGSHQ
jgi:hypothetical protein